MKRLSNLLPWLVAAIVVAFVAIMVLWITPMKTVASGSMEPTLPTGSRILIQAESSYQKGDIITFYTDDGDVVTHRLVEIAKDGSFITKGDANPTPDVWDQPLKERHVIGKVIYMTPITTATFWTSPRGIGVIICVTIMVAALLWREDESNSSERRSNPSASPA